MGIDQFSNMYVQWRDYGWGHGPGMMNWGFGMGWFGSMIMVAFGVAVIVAIIFLIRWLAVASCSKSPELAPEESALEILKKRYARGKINKQEFEERKRDLA